jgi:hypothetical protein
MGVIDIQLEHGAVDFERNLSGIIAGLQRRKEILA